MRQTYKVVRRPSGPIEPDEAHRAVKPPRPPGEPKPALDALTLLALWRRYRLAGDVANAQRTLAELQKLAERPNPRAEGDRHDTDE